MVMRRGEIRWASKAGSGKKTPVLVIQENEFNDSRIPTVLCAVISDNLRLTHAPGNVFLSTRASELGRDAVINVAQLVTVNRTVLSAPVASLGGRLLREVNDGLRLVLAV